jgi:imidazolonepropionase-like amidohydrolase
MRPIPYDDPASGTVAFPTDASPEAAARAVDRAVLERGAECIKIYDQREKRLSYAPGARLASPAQLEAIVDRARRRNVPVTMHQVTVESFRRGVAAGLTSLAHLPRDGPLDDADVEAFVASGCILEPTASLAYDLCHESADSPWFHTPRMRRVAALRERTAMELAGRFRVPAQRRAAVDGLRRLGRGETRLFGAIDLAPVFRYYAGIIGHGFDNLARLAGAGAPIACGNDAGAIPRTPAMVALELECLRLALEDRPGRVTLSGARALRIATLESARAVGLEKTHGRIAPGCAADLALWDGDPLADLRVIGSPVAALFRDGRPTVDRAGLTVRAPVARGGRNSPL